jgi:hypothetical protein
VPTLGTMSSGRACSEESRPSESLVWILELLRCRRINGLRGEKTEGDIHNWRERNKEGRDVIRESLVGRPAEECCDRDYYREAIKPDRF